MTRRDDPKQFVVEVPIRGFQRYAVTARNAREAEQLVEEQRSGSKRPGVVATDFEVWSGGFPRARRE